MKVNIVYPIGYCKGVYKAIEMARKAILDYPNKKIYCLNQIVHNQIVNDSLEKEGIIILNGPLDSLINSIDDGVVIFSAHGTNQKLIDKALKKGLIVINTICEFVQKSIDIIKKYLNENYDIIFIGKYNHPEANSICSLSNKIHLIENEDDLKNLRLNNVVVTNQTTIAITSLNSIHNTIRNIYPDAIFIDEICNATRLRQEKIKNIEKDTDGVIVIGDTKSNNTTSLYKISSLVFDTIMVNSYDEIDRKWLENKNKITLTSGTSTPQELINDIYNKLASL